MVTGLWLGFFRDFKGADTVLLSGSALGIRNLAERIRNFAVSSREELPIHERATVSTNQPARLFVVRSPRTCGDLGDATFAWMCPPLAVEDVLRKLSALSGHESAHQYFDLVGSDVQLLVSVGEYDAVWWSRKDG